MLSLIKYITPNFENSPLDLNMSGFKFEDLMYDLIANELKTPFELGAEIIKTERTRDGGVDIILQSPISLQLFGQNFLTKGKSEIIIYIECKSSKNLNLSLEKFSKNLLLVDDKKIDYFLLVSNSTISPHSFYRGYEKCLNENIEFRFVGQCFLSEFLNKYEFLVQDNCLQQEEEIPLSISYQTETTIINGRNALNLYLIIRNNEMKHHKCNFKLKSDRNWFLSDDKFEVVLDSHETVCKKISIEKVNFDGNDSILVDLTWDNNKKTVELSGTDIKYNFLLPFTGEKHKALRYEIENKAFECTNFGQLFLVGNAGIGKTRIVDEVSNSLSKKGVYCYRIFIEANQQIADIYNMIRKILNLSDFNGKDNLHNIFSQVEEMQYKHFFVVIEDLHNAPAEFFEDLKSMVDFKIKYSLKCSPIFLVSTGRNDYSVYNEAFCSYIDWISSCDSDLPITLREVKELETEECKNLITSVINDAPKSVTDQINEASHGNPFYIIQYIEYLLDTKMVYLVNKDTVGVTNAATLNQHIYVPKKIDEIIRLRLDVIKNRYLKAYEFLILMAYVGYSCSVEYWYCFFGETESNEFLFLLKTHFLKYSNNELTFDHESIYLVLKKHLTDKVNRNDCMDIFVNNSNIFALLPELKKGEVYLYQNKIGIAEKCFEKPISELMEVSNISSVNLTPSYYEYYTAIYMLAQKRKKRKLQKKTIQGMVYIAMHNLSSGQAISAFNQAEKLIETDFNEDTKLKNDIMVLKAHHFMSIGQMSMAKGLILNILSMERLNQKAFDEQCRFNLFDRAASMYLQENQIAPAVHYNELSCEVANKLNDTNLQVLSKIIAAKINFYSDPRKSLSLINEADTLLSKEKTIRINCHNKIGQLTVKIFLNKKEEYDGFINTAKLLLSESIDVNYPLATIRCKYLLAVLHYMRGKENDIEFAKKYLNDGIDTSIRNGCIKLLPNYYNLKLIIATKENQPLDMRHKYANTMLEYLRQQNLLFIGALDFGNSNIINISNYMIFSVAELCETDVSDFLKEITYYGLDSRCDFNCDENVDCRPSCIRNTKIVLKNYEKLKKGYLLFVNKKYRIKDKNTDYFIPLGI